MARVVLIRSNPVRPYPRLEKMANSISKMGFEIIILAWDRDSNYPPKEEILVLEDSTARIIRIGIKGTFSGGIKKNGIGLLKFNFFLFSWLIKNRRQYDIIHAYDFDCGFIASKVARHMKKKFIYDIADYYVDSHGLKGTKLGNIVEKKEIKVINAADVTVLCTEERIKQISGANPQRIVIIHNTPNLSQYGVDNEKIKKPSNKLKLVYVGILSPSRFLEEIADTVSKRKDCEFHVGGFGRLETVIKEYAKYDNIFFYGRIQYAKTIQLEQECDVMCALYDPDIPNHRYAAPNKFYEALALGKPLIMVRDTGMSKIVEMENLGEVIEYNKEALYNSIDHLISKRDDFMKICKREQSLYSEKYSWEIMESRIQEMYTEIIE